MSKSLHKSCFTISALLIHYICQTLLKLFLMWILAHKPLQCTDSASGNVLVTLTVWRWGNQRKILQTFKFGYDNTQTAALPPVSALNVLLHVQVIAAGLLFQRCFTEPSGRKSVNAFREKYPRRVSTDTGINCQVHFSLGSYFRSCILCVTALELYSWAFCYLCST